MTTTAMPTLTAAFLVAGHVNDLWSTWAHDEDVPGHCPECCGPCAGLKDLHDRGQLDELYGAYVNHVGGTWEGWDVEQRKVGSWLAEAWSVDHGCEHGRDLELARS